MNALVETPSGKGNVVYNDLLKERVTVKIPQGDDSFNLVEFASSEIKWEKNRPQQNSNAQSQQQKQQKDNKQVEQNKNQKKKNKDNKQN